MVSESSNESSAPPLRYSFPWMSPELKLEILSSIKRPLISHVLPLLSFNSTLPVMYPVHLEYVCALTV